MTKIQPNDVRLRPLPIQFFGEVCDIPTSIESSAILFQPANGIRSDGEIAHLVFDWDSTLVDNEGDLLINSKGRQYFSSYEWTNRNCPHRAGPLHSLFKNICQRNDFKLSILTARTAVEAHRVMTTLSSWGCNQQSLHGLHFAANMPKGLILRSIKADLFFDDLRKNVDDAVSCGITSAWIPFGIATE